MDHLENQFLHKEPLSDNVKYWYRYVDDILCLWTGTNRQLNTFLEHLNSHHKNMQFTMELGGKSINFLDLNIDITTNTHIFKIYRKPTTTDTVIPSCSQHPIAHKHAAFHSMVHRLTSIPQSKHNFQAELNTIKYIASNNGYSPQLIDKILQRKQRRKVLPLLYAPTSETVNTKTNWCTIPYLGKVSNIIAKTLKSCKYKTSFYVRGTAAHILFNSKDTRDALSNSGVYKITCKDCRKLYIGQTGRAIEIRLTEHERSWRLQKSDSTFADHVLKEGHSYQVHTEVLHVANKGRKLSLLEALEINKHLAKNPQLVLNDQLQLSTSPLLSFT